MIQLMIFMKTDQNTICGMTDQIMIKMMTMEIVKIGTEIQMEERIGKNMVDHYLLTCQYKGAFFV
ncbi:hypothetical protein ABLT31_27830 [Ammoniphilus sp. 3BR4]